MLENKFDNYWTTHPKDGRLVYRQVNRNRRFYDLVKRYLVLNNQERVKVLEVGCGTAIDSYYLKELTGADIFALDSSSGAVRQAQKLKDYFDQPVGIIQGGIEKICFKDKTFDLVFSQGVMEHFRDCTQAYREQIRVLKNNGILIVHVPQRYNIYSIFSYIRSRTSNEFGWESPYSVKDMKRIEKELGLNLLEVQGQDFFSLEICRFFNTQSIADEPRGHSVRLKGAHKYLDIIINSLEEMLWRLIGNRFGKYTMMNIIGVFRKGDF